MEIEVFFFTQFRIFSYNLFAFGFLGAMFCLKIPSKIIVRTQYFILLLFQRGVLGINFVIHRLKSRQIGSNERISIKHWVWGSYMAPTLAWSPIDPSIVTKKQKSQNMFMLYITIYQQIGNFRPNNFTKGAWSQNALLQNRNHFSLQH